MTRKCAYAFAPVGWKDWQLRALNSTGPTETGLTFAATDGGGNSPTGADNWIKLESTFASASVLFCFNPNVPTISSYFYACFKFSLNGSVPAGATSFYYGLGMSSIVGALQYVQVSSSTFNIRARDITGSTDIGTGSTAYSTDTELIIRTEFDGSTLKVWVNGSLEIDASYSKTLSLKNLTGVRPPSGMTHYYCTGAVFSADSTADRPDADVRFQEILPNAEQTSPANENEYGDEADGLSNDAQVSDVLLDGSDLVATANYIVGNSTVTREQMWEFPDTYTPTTGYTPEAIVMREAVRTTQTNKTVNHKTRLRNGSTDLLEVAMTNVTSTIWAGRVLVFHETADGSVWSEAEVDAMRLGVGHTNANDKSFYCAGQVFEIVETKDDAPAAGDRRRVMGQVV